MLRRADPGPAVLLASGYVWDTAQKPRDPSPFLLELRPFAEVDEWFEPEPDAINPVTAEARTRRCGRSTRWGRIPGDRGPGRRADVEAGAALGAGPAVRHVADRARASGPQQWRIDVDRLLAERGAAGQRFDGRRRAAASSCRCPNSSSSNATRANSPRACAGRCPRRPRRGRAAAPRSTPGSSSAGRRRRCSTSISCPAPPTRRPTTREFETLRAAFQASEWAQAHADRGRGAVRDGGRRHRVVRGRMDAVFGNAADGWVVVDWKTGRTADRCGRDGGGDPARGVPAGVGPAVRHPGRRGAPGARGIPLRPNQRHG